MLRFRVFVAVIASWVLCFDASAAVIPIAHRGYSTAAPENTLSAIRAAAGFVTGCEFDVRQTADGQLILMHDADVARTTDGSGNVSSMTFDQIRALDAGSWFSPQYAGEQVPTLLEAVQTCLQNGITPCIEVKAGNVNAYYSVLAPYRDVVEVHSFDWSFLNNLNSLDSGFTTVAIGSGDLLAKLPTMPSCIDKVSWAHANLSESVIQAAHDSGRDVYAWTVNDSAKMQTLIDWNVDGICSDNAVMVWQATTGGFERPDYDFLRPLCGGLTMNWSFDDGLANPSATEAADTVHGLGAVLSSSMGNGAWVGPSEAKLGGALRFSGGEDIATVGASPETTIQTRAVSISTWVKLDELPSQIGAPFAGIYDSVADGYVLYLDKSSGELRMKVTAGAAERPGIPQTMLEKDSWHHVVGVYDGGTVSARIYLDGELVDVHVNPALATVPAAQSASFGNAGSLDSPFRGMVDETAVWDRPLSEAEVRFLYNQGAGRPVKEQNAVIGSLTPIVHLPLDRHVRNVGSGGNDLDGLLVDGSLGTSSYVAGKVEKALKLDNPDRTTGGDVVSIPYEITDIGTVSLWINPTDWYNYQTIFDNSVDANDWEMWIYDSGVLRFRVEADSYASCDLNNLGAPGDWFHLAATWVRDGSGVALSLFVNGELRETDIGSWVDPGDTFFLAGGNTGNDHGKTTFDDLRIYDTLLTSDEIWALYRGQIIEYAGIPGDLDGDGAVGSGDLDVVRAHWGEQVPPGNYSLGDADGDGAVGSADLDIVRGNWGENAGTVPASVPEPGIVMLLASFVVSKTRSATRRGSRRSRREIGRVLRLALIDADHGA